MHTYIALVLSGILIILATLTAGTLGSWWWFIKQAHPGPACTPTSTDCHFKDGTRVIASEGSILLSVGQPDTSIAIHSPDGDLLWSGRVERLGDDG